MPVPKGKQVGNRPLPSRPGPAPEQEQEQEQEQPQRASSKADAFNNQQASTGFNIPTGQYIANLIGAEHLLEEAPSEKESIKFTFEVAEGEQEGKEVTAWYNLFDKDGNPLRGGEFFKSHVYILGIRQEGAEIKYDEIDDICKEIEAERPLCNITSKQNGPYFNIYLQGLAEG